MREVLLPPYLAGNPLWLEFTRAIDTLFADVDYTSKQLRFLRNAYAYSNQVAKEKVSKGLMLSPQDFEYTINDKSYLVKQVSLVGLNLTDASALNEELLLNLFRHLSEYWYNKGTVKLESFLNFIFKSSISLKSLWTEDYINFVEESPSVIANSVYNGGTFYPTTHVSLDLGVVASDSPLVDISVKDFVTFFNDIANFNLVLYSVTREDVLPITLGSSVENPLTTPTPMISLGLLIEEEW